VEFLAGYTTYDNSPASQGVEPYSEATSVMINNVQGTVISVPSLPVDQQIPESDDKRFFVICLVTNAVNENGESTDITRVSIIKMPFIIPNPSPWDESLSVPSKSPSPKCLSSFQIRPPGMNLSQFHRELDRKRKSPFFMAASITKIFSYLLSQIHGNFPFVNEME
jgi:hypothetical protein